MGEERHPLDIEQQEDWMLEEQISKDYIQAMKARDAVRSSTLSFLRSQLKYARLDKRVHGLEDQDVIGVIKKQIKQRQDSIEQYQKGGRQDLVDKESAELNILKSYLPQEMTESELKPLVEQAIQEAQACSIKDMGKVMKLMTVKVAGRADNAVLSDLVKKVLLSSSCR
ncbi:MAG TPA: aspartyl-tRNA amidotransferase [Candidatus Omnitrophica bacterium]|nr:aspartyl-tRNA amidotransferase [Candidatus Omnitrophota bacterium]